MAEHEAGPILITDGERHWYVGYRAADVICGIADAAGEINHGDVERIEIHFAGPDAAPKPKIVHRLPPFPRRGS